MCFVSFLRPGKQESLKYVKVSELKFWISVIGLNKKNLQNRTHPVAVESLSAGEAGGHALLERKNLDASERADSLQAFVLIVKLLPRHAH